MPPYLRRAKSIEELLPRLYLKGISTGDFSEALAALLGPEAPGLSASILEGLEEILTVIRLGLPQELRRSLACTNIIENVLGTVRQVAHNVKRWRNAEMALRWTAAGLLKASKTFRRLKAYRQLPILRNALQEHLRKAQTNSAIETIMKAA